jgi:hypothetical protein
MVLVPGGCIVKARGLDGRAQTLVLIGIEAASTVLAIPMLVA